MRNAMDGLIVAQSVVVYVSIVATRHGGRVLSPAGMAFSALLKVQMCKCQAVPCVSCAKLLRSIEAQAKAGAKGEGLGAPRRNAG